MTITTDSCKHCGHGKVNRPRGLCWTCYYAPGVRGDYAPHPVHGRHAINRDTSPNEAPTERPLPVDRAERIDYYAERAAARVSLFGNGIVMPDDCERACVACGGAQEPGSTREEQGWQNIRTDDDVCLSVCGECFEEWGWWDMLTRKEYRDLRVSLGLQEDQVEVLRDDVVATGTSRFRRGAKR